MAMSLGQLQMLARERRPSQRHELLRGLADALFDPAQDLTVRERDLFDEIIEKVLNDVEPLARQEFAERIAMRLDAPRRVVVRLAGDIIAVAAPVLIRSPLLGDNDLMVLAQRQSQDHLLAIARRDELSEPITDILVDRGDALVLDSMAENPGARFSRPGAAVLMEKARLREALWRRLAARADLPLRRTDGLAARQLAAAERARPRDQLAALIAGGNLRLSDAVIELADADRVADLAILVCGRAGGNSHAFLGDLFAPDETPLMMVCRAALLDLESFSAVLRLRHRRRPFGAGVAGRLLRAYQALPAPGVLAPMSADSPEEDKLQGLCRPAK
jgi:hypothetical protein